MTKLNAFGKQMRVLESFYSSTNPSKKTEIALFYGTESLLCYDIVHTYMEFKILSYLVGHFTLLN
jgi:membrane-anchored protein YejM (alkaline phosphatase superfamily)